MPVWPKANQSVALHVTLFVCPVAKKGISLRVSLSEPIQDRENSLQFCGFLSSVNCISSRTVSTERTYQQPHAAEFHHWSGNWIGSGVRSGSGSPEVRDGLCTKRSSTLYHGTTTLRHQPILRMMQARKHELTETHIHLMTNTSRLEMQDANGWWNAHFWRSP